MKTVVDKVSPREIEFSDLDEHMREKSILVYAPDKNPHYGVIGRQKYFDGQYTVKCFNSEFTHGNGWDNFNTLKELYAHHKKHGKILLFDDDVDFARWVIRRAGGPLDDGFPKDLEKFLRREGVLDEYIKSEREWSSRAGVQGPVWACCSPDSWIIYAWGSAGSDWRYINDRWLEYLEDMDNCMTRAGQIA